MKRSLFLTCACLFAASFTAGCSGTTTPTDDKPDTTCATSPAMVTTAQLQADVLAMKCVNNCHTMGGSGAAYGDYSTVDKAHEMVNKESYLKGSAGTLKIVDQMAGTTAEKLANSTLWLKVSSKKDNAFKGPKGEFTSQRMPQPPDPVLSDADIQKIKDWICTGSNKM